MLTVFAIALSMKWFNIEHQNTVSSKINSLYAQHSIDAGWVMTFLLYKNTQLFSAVLAGIENSMRMEQNLPFKRSLIVKKGATGHFSSLFDWINYLSVLSTQLIALKKPTSSETAHEIVCALHIN